MIVHKKHIPIVVWALLCLCWPALAFVGLRWPSLAADEQNDTPTSHHDSLMLSLAGHGWVGAGKDEKTHPGSSGVGGGSCDWNRSGILSAFKLITIKQRINEKIPCPSSSQMTMGS